MTKFRNFTLLELSGVNLFLIHHCITKLRISMEQREISVLYHTISIDKVEYNIVGYTT